MYSSEFSRETRERENKTDGSAELSSERGAIIQPFLSLSVDSIRKTYDVTYTLTGT